MFFYEENGTLFFFKVIKYFFWVRIFLKFIYNYHIYGISSASSQLCNIFSIQGTSYFLKQKCYLLPKMWEL